jgi:hypothetical protein
MMLIEASYMYTSEYNISKLHNILTTIHPDTIIKLKLMEYKTNAHHLINIIKETKITLSSDEADAIYNIMKKEPHSSLLVQSIILTNPNNYTNPTNPQNKT